MTISKRNRNDTKRRQWAPIKKNEILLNATMQMKFISYIFINIFSFISFHFFFATFATNICIAFCPFYADCAFIHVYYLPSVAVAFHLTLVFLSFSGLPPFLYLKLYSFQSKNVRIIFDFVKKNTFISLAAISFQMFLLFLFRCFLIFIFLTISRPVYTDLISQLATLLCISSFCFLYCYFSYLIFQLANFLLSSFFFSFCSVKIKYFLKTKRQEQFLFHLYETGSIKSH